MNKLVLIDSHALVHRAFHALPPTLNSPGGVPTNAVFGFISVFLKMIKDLNPDYIAATFDLAAPTFRHEEFADYKVHREKAPDELYNQIPLVKEALKYFGVPIYEKAGFEADDLIGSIAERSKKTKDLQTIIVTGDMDTLQLVEGDKVVVFTLRKGVTDTVTYDEKEVIKRFGIKPNQLIDFKGLKGDPSDNIPGVPGVGEKTAAILIKEFGTLEKLYEYLEKKAYGKAEKEVDGKIGRKKKDEKIKPKQKTKKETVISEKLAAKLLENKDMAFFSKKLATIIRDVDMDFSVEKADWRKGMDRPALEQFLKEHGLYSLVRRLDESGLSAAKGFDFEAGVVIPREEIKKAEDVKHLKTKSDIAYFLAKAAKEKEFVFDISGAGAGADNPKISILFGGICHTFSLTDESAGLIKDVLEDDKIAKVCHDLKSVIKTINPLGAGVAGRVFDTKLAAYLLNSDQRDYDLAKIYFAEFKEAGPEPLEKSSPDELAQRPKYIAKLKARFAERLAKENLSDIFEEIEVPVVQSIAEMEMRGIKVDEKAIAKLDKIITKELAGLEKQIYKMAGQEFNINSPSQLSDVLFNKLGIKGKVRKTGKGALSTAAPELEKLAPENPVIDLILKYREIQKLKTTYVDPFPGFVDPKTGRLHTTFNQTGTTTGRMSSQDPNLQNIPARTELGQEFRKVFVATPGFKLVSFDYSQLELRIAAHISGDQKMIAAFRSGEDIHTRTAAEIWNVPPEKVDANMRREAKVLNFGVLYGMGIMGFQRVSGVSRERAREFIDRYKEEFSGVNDYMESVKKAAFKDGYVTTIFGRKRWLPEIRSRMPHMIASAERMAINMPIQGTAADLMKLAMIGVSRLLHGSKDAYMLLQVHDELLFEIKEDKVVELSRKIKEKMESAHQLVVPVAVDVKVGDNWSEMEKLKL